jgi:hypothetical protein
MMRYSFILKTAALLVPSEHRAEWFAEWITELWYVLQTPDSTALSFCLGAFRDALWLRRNLYSPVPRVHTWLQSPLRCLLWLASLAAVAVAVFVYLLGHSFGPAGTYPRAPHSYGAPILAYLFMIAVAFLVISVTSSLSLGEYPTVRSSPARARRFHRWAFCGLKFALIVPIVLCGTFDVVKLLSAPASRVLDPMAIWSTQPQAALIFFVIAFRWALNDQRRRCPVCLRLLNESASIGQFSHNFLEWYGTELFCSKGHGLLHVPKIATTYSTQHWRDLDRSWSVLFS